MEAQQHRPSSHAHHPHPQVVEGGGEQEHHHEKKSVLKKVKDKAKKIKDTIKRHGHGHGHSHEHQVGYERDRGVNREEGRYEEEKQEMVDDPQVHGAPMYESSAIRSRTIPKEADINIQRSTDTGDDRFDHNVRDEGITKPSVPGQMGSEYGRQPAVEARMHETKTTTTLPSIREAAVYTKKPNVDESKVRIGQTMGLEEDPHSPKRAAEIPSSNYQSKVTDTTGVGGKEADVGRHFNNLNVHGASSVSRPAAEHGDPFAPPPPTPTESQFDRDREDHELKAKTQDHAMSEDVPQDTVAGKISSATAAIADKAVSAKNMVAAKLGYDGTGGQEGQEHSSGKPASELVTDYAHKVVETLAPVYEKVAGAGTVVMSKVHGGTGGDEHAEGADKGVATTEYLAEKLRPGDEDKALSEVISEALHKKKDAGEEHPVGKVTESEEVAARLGTAAETKREGDDALAAGAESSGQTVTDRLKDAVGSWLGKSSGIQTAQDSVAGSFVSDAGSGGTGVGRGEAASGERRNQGS
ncbi:Low-temperature-induced protein [Sesamum alatum]|uniref:Low-temperature-induced protein n=1 Tax=Sesamum alatum TaxID=300844 RepID=A0AAE1YU86_9LAMI|nr:Low-temperature-induced protein [Sesamum alatum]